MGEGLSSTLHLPFTILHPLHCFISNKTAEVKGGEGWVKGSFHPFTALNIYGSTI